MNVAGLRAQREACGRALGGGGEDRHPGQRDAQELGTVGAASTSSYNHPVFAIFSLLTAPNSQSHRIQRTWRMITVGGTWDQRGA